MKKILFFLVTTLSLTNYLAAQQFAVIGDYGTDDEYEAQVASLVKSWNPEFILTLGDNNYNRGEASTIDKNIGQYYSDFIHPYRGSYGRGASTNRFFPCTGNHDYYTKGAKPYYDYFTLPGNERYYDFVRGNVHFFSINSNPQEPDGITASSRQAAWLKEKLSASTAPWKIVYFHHAPYSTGEHGSIAKYQWPFKEWGATTVIAGHNHMYERLVVDGFPYFVNGTGGRDLDAYSRGPLPETKRRSNQKHGAMYVKATAETITFEYRHVGGALVDTHTIKREEGVPKQPGTITLSIAKSADDAEERQSDGKLYTSSSDLELGFDAYQNQGFQTVGLRYTKVNIPKQATIQEARIIFTTKGTSSGSSQIQFVGHRTGYSYTFNAGAKYTLSRRPSTQAKVDWSPADWRSPDQRVSSPDLKSIIQEIVNRSDWSSGNALTLKIKGSKGTRRAWSYDSQKGAAVAPQLVVRYTTSGTTASRSSSAESQDSASVELQAQDLGVSAGISVYPNPVVNENELTVRLAKDVAAQRLATKLYDASGKLIHKGVVIFSNRRATYQLPTVQMPAGVYFLDIGNEQYQERAKILIEK